MLIDIFILAVGLIFILFSAELFTNSVEYIGDKLNLSKNFTGSVLAAVGTALPESILPIIAILFFKDKSGEDIGLGAILGAPFMLSTLAFPLIGLTVVIGYLLKKRSLELKVEEMALRKDIVFFLFAYTIALFSVHFHNISLVKTLTAIILVFIYILYIVIVLKNESAEMEETHNLLFSKLKIKESLPLAFFQFFTALIIMIVGAHIFVDGIEKLSKLVGLSPLIFSLLLAPIATELPEKINSVIWVLREQDTLAVGNVSGAMVFQSSIPVSIGLILTDWNLSTLALTSGFLAIISGFLVLAISYLDKKLIPFGFSVGILFYITYIGIILGVA